MRLIKHKLFYRLIIKGYYLELVNLQKYFLYCYGRSRYTKYFKILGWLVFFSKGKQKTVNFTTYEECISASKLSWEEFTEKYGDIDDTLVWPHRKEPEYKWNPS